MNSVQQRSTDHFNITILLLMLSFKTMYMFVNSCGFILFPGQQGAVTAKIVGSKERLSLETG